MQVASIRCFTFDNMHACLNLPLSAHCRFPVNLQSRGHSESFSEVISHVPDSRRGQPTAREYQLRHRHRWRCRELRKTFGCTGIVILYIGSESLTTAKKDLAPKQTVPASESVHASLIDQPITSASCRPRQPRRTGSLALQPAPSRMRCGSFRCRAVKIWHRSENGEPSVSARNAGSTDDALSTYLLRNRELASRREIASVNPSASPGPIRKPVPSGMTTSGAPSISNETQGFPIASA